MTTIPNPRARLRTRLKSDEPVLAPGAYDCITARLIEQAGFDAVYMTGAGTSATLGYPDYGLLTMTEMVSNAGRIAAVLTVPLIADADAGYGNELNVFRTVREYERAGVSGIHVEDQVAPKRCGHLDGKEVIPLHEYEAKIRAAVDARCDPDFLIIARTDARGVTSYPDAIARARAAIAAGADMAFVEALQTMEEIMATPADVGAPCLLNIVHGGKTPAISPDTIRQAGYRVAILPGVMTRTVIAACDATLSTIRGGNLNPSVVAQGSPNATFARMGGVEWEPRRTRYAEPSASKSAAS